MWPPGWQGNPWTQRRWRRSRRSRPRCESVSYLSLFWNCFSFLISFYLFTIPSWQRALTGCESHVLIYEHIYIFLFYCFLIMHNNIQWYILSFSFCLSFCFPALTPYILYYSYFSQSIHLALTLSFCCAAENAFLSRSEHILCVCVCVFGEEGFELMQLCICSCQGYKEMSRNIQGAALLFQCVRVCLCGSATCVSPVTI